MLDITVAIAILVIAAFMIHSELCAIRKALEAIAKKP